MSLDDVGNELYGLPLDQFVGARDARAKELAASLPPRPGLLGIAWVHRSRDNSKELSKRPWPNRRPSEELRAGRLTAALSHVGFGEVTTLQRGVRERSKRQHRDPEKDSSALRPTSTPRRVADGQRSLSDAEPALDNARAALESSERELDKARQRHHGDSIRQREAAKALRDAERELAQATAPLHVARERRQREERDLRLAGKERRRRAAGSRCP